MRRLARLAAVESRYSPASDFKGMLEIHFTEAWPKCLANDHGLQYAQCEEHGPRCAVSSSRIAAAGRTVIIRGGAWLGI